MPNAQDVLDSMEQIDNLSVIERAVCEALLKDLSKRYFEVLERYKKLGGDDSNCTL